MRNIHIFMMSPNLLVANVIDFIVSIGLNKSLGMNKDCYVKVMNKHPATFSKHVIL